MFSKKSFLYQPLWGLRQFILLGPLFSLTTNFLRLLCLLNSNSYLLLLEMFLSLVLNNSAFWGIFVPFTLLLPMTGADLSGHVHLELSQNILNFQTP